MDKIESIATETFQKGFKLSQFQLSRQYGIGGDYYYRRYVRIWNRLEKEADATKAQELKNDNQNLYTILREQTEPLRVEYLRQTEEWSIMEYVRCERYTEKSIVRSNYPDRKAYDRAYQTLLHCTRIVNAGSDAFIAKYQKLAELHYEDSLLKLIRRIEQKGLNKSCLNVKTGFVNVNLEIVLTDGIKTVRAWTIIASGEVQRPHYRYLVK